MTSNIPRRRSGGVWPGAALPGVPRVPGERQHWPLHPRAEVALFLVQGRLPGGELEGLSSAGVLQEARQPAGVPQRLEIVISVMPSFLTLSCFLPDYVGFIKKIMKLMQKEHPMMSKIEVQLTQEKEMESLPNRPSEYQKSRNKKLHKCFMLFLSV